MVDGYRRERPLVSRWVTGILQTAQPSKICNGETLPVHISQCGYRHASGGAPSERQSIRMFHSRRLLTPKIVTAPRAPEDLRHPECQRLALAVEHRVDGEPKETAPHVHGFTAPSCGPLNNTAQRFFSRTADRARDVLSSTWCESCLGASRSTRGGERIRHLPRPRLIRLSPLDHWSHERQMRRDFRRSVSAAGSATPARRPVTDGWRARRTRALGSPARSRPALTRGCEIGSQNSGPSDASAISSSPSCVRPASCTGLRGSRGGVAINRDHALLHVAPKTDSRCRRAD